jgi:hypothetical protein
MEQSKVRSLYPRKLQPPLAVLQKIKERNAARFSSIPIVRFLQIFFGEGF